jgi:hypothetical protein
MAWWLEHPSTIIGNNVFLFDREEAKITSRRKIVRVFIAPLIFITQATQINTRQQAELQIS